MRHKEPECRTADIFPHLGVVDVETAFSTTRELQQIIKDGVVIILSAIGNVGAGHIRQGLDIQRYCELFNIPVSHHILDVGAHFVNGIYAKGQSLGMLGPMEKAASFLPMAVFNHSTYGIHKADEVTAALNGTRHFGPVLVCTTHYAAEHTAILMANSGVFGEDTTILSFIPDPWVNKDLAAMRSYRRSCVPHFKVTHDAATADEYLRITPHADPDHVLPWGTLTIPDFTFAFQNVPTNKPSIGVDFAGNPHMGLLSWTMQLLQEGRELIKTGQLSVDIHTMTHRKHFQQLVDRAKDLHLDDVESLRICCDDDIVSAAIGRDQRAIGNCLPQSTTLWGSVPAGRLHAVCGKGELPLERRFSIGRNSEIFGRSTSMTVSGEGHEVGNARAGVHLGNRDFRGRPVTEVIESVMSGDDDCHLNSNDNPFMALHWALTHR